MMRWNVALRPAAEARIVMRLMWSLGAGDNHEIRFLWQKSHCDSLVKNEQAKIDLREELLLSESHMLTLVADGGRGSLASCCVTSPYFCALLPSSPSLLRGRSIAE